MYYARKDSAANHLTREITQLQEKLISKSIAGAGKWKSYFARMDRKYLAATSFSNKGKTYLDVDVNLCCYCQPSTNTENPKTVGKVARRAGIEVDSVPHRNTMEMKAHELGAI